MPPLRCLFIIAVTFFATQALPPRDSVPGTSPISATSRGDTAAFAAAVYVARDGARLPYRLLSPAPATPGRRYPLILQLHGSGAIGTDNSAQLGAFATGWAAPATRARFPAYVLVPQFADRTVEYRTANGMPVSRERAPLAAALELLDSLRRTLAVDTTRVYAAGFSMGGSSVWHALLDRPAVFAGAMVIAGVPPDATDLRRVPRVPLLLLHGTADTENPFAAARGAYESLLRMKRDGVEFREYPGLAHEIPPEVLTGDWWREWLFRRHR
jgi:predicted peptidase